MLEVLRCWGGNAAARRMPTCSENGNFAPFSLHVGDEIDECWQHTWDLPQISGGTQESDSATWGNAMRKPEAIANPRQTRAYTRGKPPTLVDSGV